LEFFIRSEEEYAAAMNMKHQAFAIAIPVDWDSTPLIPLSPVLRSALSAVHMLFSGNAQT
jgi:hypothetical protein